MAEGILHKGYKPLGEGTYGAVFHVGDYIVKRMILMEDYEVKEFQDEVRIWEHLAAIPAMRPHMPHFCRALLMNVPPGPHYGFIFQLYEPVRELYEIIQDATVVPLTADMGYKLFTDITNAFSILHQAGIVHRDIKTNNILIRENGTPIIIDFGVACRLFDEHGKLRECGDSWRGIKNYTPQNYRAVEKRYHLPRIFTNELQSVKRGWFSTTKKPLKVKVRGVADPINNTASDMYTLSITVLRPLVSVTDWSGNRRYEKWAKKTIQEYERAIVPFLAASVARKGMEANGNNSNVSSRRNNSSRRNSTRKRS